MKAISPLVVAALSFLAASSLLADNPKPGEWELVFADEFSGTSLDTVKWNRIPYVSWTNPPDWRRYQSQDPRLTEANPTEGTMTLWGRYGDYETQAHVSGLVATGVNSYACGGITTEGTFSFRHGYVEVRARYDCAMGVWPAIWMLPVNNSWPTTGEIDVMEHLNYMGTVYQTVHYANASGGDASKGVSPSWSDVNAKLEWHTYGMAWTSDAITFYLDGVATGTITATQVGSRWPFGEESEEFYLILDQQIGGNWVTSGGAKEIDQQTLATSGVGMELDYVRVYSTPDYMFRSIPEPASAGLTLLGALLLLRRRRR